MKKLLMVLVLALTLVGCGTGEKIYDQQNYESLSNECGTLELYSGGVMVKEFPNACIMYSSADTDAIFFRVGDDEKYWQGDAYMNVN